MHVKILLYVRSKVIGDMQTVFKNIFIYFVRLLETALTTCYLQDDTVLDYCIICGLLPSDNT